MKFYSSLKFYFIYLWAILFFLQSCSSDDEVTPIEEKTNEVLVSHEEIANFSTTIIQLGAISVGYSDLVDLIEYSVKVYRVNYKTTYQGNEIIASGLIMIPDGATENLPIASIHHGTIFAHNDAPSIYADGATGFEVFASAGYITVVPDYIGFGSSSNILHPYYDYTHSSLAVNDMILAAKEFATEFELNLSGQLFLAGYSQGGNVTVAVQKYLETNPIDGLSIASSAAGAGGYNLKGILQKVINEETFSSPNYLAYIIHSYNTTNNWDRPLTDFFKEPYASRIPGLFDGSTGGSGINDQLTNNIAELFNPDFLVNLNAETETQFISTLESNSLHDWSPTAPLTLYHGTADEVVPFSDSEETFTSFQNNQSNTVDFVSIPEATHSTGIFGMIVDVVPKFENARTQ